MSRKNWLGGKPIDGDGGREGQSEEAEKGEEFEQRSHEMIFHGNLPFGEGVGNIGFRSFFCLR
ncbi:MAG: hypothetical protein ACJAQT_001749 [Akkermansiaceae bacterium]|jgi:hypothetical protein